MIMVQRNKEDFADVDYFREGVKCQNACPVETDACGYIRAIAHGDFEGAYLIARGPNPRASILWLRLWGAVRGDLPPM